MRSRSKLRQRQICVNTFSKFFRTLARRYRQHISRYSGTTQKFRLDVRNRYDAPAQAAACSRLRRENASSKLVWCCADNENPIYSTPLGMASVQDDSVGFRNARHQAPIEEQKIRGSA